MQYNSVSQSRGQVSEADFISKVYLWMSAGLALTALTSFALLTQPALLQIIVTNKILFWGLFFAQLGVVLWLSAAIKTMSASLATSLFLLYSMLTGITFTPIFLIYTNSSIGITFAVTAGTFFFFSLYGRTTQKDLTSIGSICVMGVFGIIIASIVNIFLKSSVLYWISTFVGIAVFLGLIAWDTQKLKGLYALGFEDQEIQKKGAILGALTLYLDFINLFILLLRIFGRRRD